MLSGGRPGHMAGIHVIPPPPALEVGALVVINDRIREKTWRGIVTNVRPDGIASIMPTELVDTRPLDQAPRRMLYDDVGLRDAPVSSPPTIPLPLADVYLAGWELRANHLPFEEFVVEHLGQPAGIGARFPVELQIARGDMVAATFTLTNEEWNAEGVTEFVAAVQRAKAERT